MAKGDNKCKGCGQFSGRGHKCPATDTQFVSPANQQQVGAPSESSAARGQVSDRVSRAQVRLSQDSSGIDVPEVRSAIAMLRTHGPDEFGPDEANAVKEFVARRADGADKVQAILQEPEFANDPERSAALKAALTAGKRKRATLTPQGSINRRVRRETRDGFGKARDAKYPTEFKDEVVGYYINNEVSAPAAARKFGISPDLMDSWLKARGIKKRPQHKPQNISPEQRQAIAKDYAYYTKHNTRKTSTREIIENLARKHNVSLTTVESVVAPESK